MGCNRLSTRVNHETHRGTFHHGEGLIVACVEAARCIYSNEGTIDGVSRDFLQLLEMVGLEKLVWVVVFSAWDSCRVLQLNFQIQLSRGPL